MNLFWNVGKGATSKPRLVISKYFGRPEDKDIDIAFVGKGITFDTGGLNIKPSAGQMMPGKLTSMECMYGDKGGACAVIGALVAC
jgi:leucyl aminopeptidase